MILLVLLAVALVAAAGAGVFGVGLLSGDRREERTGLLALLSAPLVLLVGVVLTAAVVLGVGGGSESPDAPTAPRDRPVAAPLPDARLDRVSADIPVVRLDAVDKDDGFAPYRPVTGLVPGAVVRVLAEGFDRYERGVVEQCVVELGRRTACGEGFPVQFDGEGRADFQVAVRADISPGGCRLGQATCLLRVTAGSGRHGSAQTVLVDRVNAGTVRVEPAGPLADGQTVDVVVAGFPAGTTATAVLCAPPEAYDARRCAPPAPASTFAVDSTGGGRTTLVVAAGRLGPDAALCGPRRVCGVAVVVGTGFVAAPVEPVRFSLAPGVAYEAGRLVPGVLIAIVLGGLAVAIATRTDWTKPTEAATPALDGSDLRTGQSLDDLFGTEEQLDARDPIPW